jgi:hypothetical protein
MERQTTNRHGFFGRLPLGVIFRYPFQRTACAGDLVIEVEEQNLSYAHVGLSDGSVLGR